MSVLKGSSGPRATAGQNYRKLPLNHQTLACCLTRAFEPSTDPKPNRQATSKRNQCPE